MPHIPKDAYAVSPGIRRMVQKGQLTKQEVDHLIAEHRRYPGMGATMFTSNDGEVVHVVTNDRGLTWIETDLEYRKLRGK